MSDDTNQKSRGPRKGGGAGRGGGGRDGGKGSGEGGRGGPPRGGAGARSGGGFKSGERTSRPSGERKPFRARPEGAERPARTETGERPPRRFEKPQERTGARPGAREGTSRPPRDGAERKPFRDRAEGGERPFRARPEGERPARRFDNPGGRSGADRPPRAGGARPFRARPEGERPARAEGDARPPRRSERSSGPRPEGGRTFEKPRFDKPRGDRPERGRASSERPRRARPDETAIAAPIVLAPQEPERIAKVMARAGIASRRDAEAMIAEGRVSVNGRVIESPALDIGPADAVLVDGEPLPARERTRLWLYHKPRGLVTTNHDPEGRPTVFDALPEELPRVLSIGRLDINTEGLLLLTNDGGLARMLELPETGWLRRYRVRAFGSVTQERLDSLRDGITIEGIAYGPVTARFERQQGANTWLVVDLREGKNREVKTVLEHLGLEVNRLIRVSFGPFQLGDLPEGETDEVRSRVLKDQLGEELAVKAGVDFQAPRREELAPRRDEAPAPTPERRPARTDARRAPAGDDRPRRRPPGADAAPTREDKAPAARGDKPWTKTVWRDAEAAPVRERKAAPRRGADPKAERQAREEAGGVKRERGAAIADPKGRRVLVERVRAPGAEDEAPTSKRRPDRVARSERGRAETFAPRGEERGRGDERPARAPRGERPARGFGERSGGGPSNGKPRGAGPGAKPGGFKPGGSRPGGKGPRPGGPPRGKRD